MVKNCIKLKIQVVREHGGRDKQILGVVEVDPPQSPLPLGKTLLPRNEIIQRKTSAHAIILSKQR